MSDIENEATAISSESADKVKEFSGSSEIPASEEKLTGIQRFAEKVYTAIDDRLGKIIEKSEDPERILNALSKVGASIGAGGGIFGFALSAASGEEVGPAGKASILAAGGAVSAVGWGLSAYCRLKADALNSSEVGFESDLT